MRWFEPLAPFAFQGLVIAAVSCAGCGPWPEEPPPDFTSTCGVKVWGADREAFAESEAHVLLAFSVVFPGWDDIYLCQLLKGSEVVVRPVDGAEGYAYTRGVVISRLDNGLLAHEWAHWFSGLAVDHSITCDINDKECMQRKQHPNWDAFEAVELLSIIPVKDWP